MEKFTDKERLQVVYHALTRNGYLKPDHIGQPDKRVTLRDLVTEEDLRPWIPLAVRRIVMDAVEPSMVVIPNLFARLDIPDSQVIEIGAISAITAGKVKAGMDWPSSTLAFDTVGAATAITIDKYGVAINISSDVIKESKFDIVALWLRAAGAALARLKESLGIRLIDEMGQTIFDNAAPANSELGVCTGRNIAGAANGSMTLNDVFDMWAYMALRGFMPDTILMSPLAWKVFAVDPQLKEIVLNGAVLATRRMPLGQPAPGFEDPFNGLGLKMVGTGNAEGSNPYLTTLTPVNSTWNMPPRYLPSPIKVIVSHLVPFTTRANAAPVTDIIMCDSQRCGILVQKEEVQSEEADIFTTSVHVVHLFEKYGMNVFDQGKGIAVARNVVVAPNYVFDNVNSRTLNEIPRNTPIV